MPLRPARATRPGWEEVVKRQQKRSPQKPSTTPFSPTLRGKTRPSPHLAELVSQPTKGGEGAAEVTRVTCTRVQEPTQCSGKRAETQTRHCPSTVEGDLVKLRSRCPRGGDSAAEERGRPMGPDAKSAQQPVCVNGVLLAHGHLHAVYGCCRAISGPGSETTRPPQPTALTLQPCREPTRRPSPSSSRR